MYPSDDTNRQDVIQNAVNHQMADLEQSVTSPATLETLLNSELNYDLITWSRQYLEPYLDSDESGRVPLTPERLQDVLEAAFDRDQALAVGFLAEINAGKGPQALPGSSVQIADARLSDPQHPYELLFNEANTKDLKALSAKIKALSEIRHETKDCVANRGQADVERRETTSLAVEHNPGTGVVHLHDKVTGADARKLLGGGKAPQQVQAILERLGPETRVEPALTDSGTYRGSVVVETAHELIQRISPQYAVIHRKDDLDSKPRIGDHVCVTYSNGNGHVHKVRERSRNKELAR